MAEINLSFFEKNRLCVFVFAAVLAVFAAVYLELFNEFMVVRHAEVQGAAEQPAVVFDVPRFFLLFAVLFLCAAFLLERGQRLFDFVFRYRLLIGLVIIAICVLFELSGSSIACLGAVLDDQDFEGVLFGAPRFIRSDEWTVGAPLGFSQYFNSYDPVSSLVRGTATDTTMVYGLPSWSLITLFKPQSWGCLVFGPVRGIAFRWAFVFVATFLVSFECARLYTGDNRYLSAAAAVLIAFSPFTLWWSGISHLLFGQGLVVVLHYYLREVSVIKRALKAALLFWLAGCYLFTMYPAWMVPMFYVFLLMGIFDLRAFLKGRKELKKKPWHEYMKSRAKVGRAVGLSDVLFLLLFAALLVMAVVYIFSASAKAVATTSATVYPGARFETGGGGLWLLFNYGASLLFPLADTAPVPNASEASGFFALFPLSIFLSAIALVRIRPVNWPLLGLLALQLVFIEYVVFGFPEFLSRVTLMSYVPARRLIFAVGYLDVVLLIKSLSLLAQCNLPRAVADKGPLPNERTGFRVISFFVPVLLLCVFVTIMAYTTQPAVMNANALFGTLLFIATFVFLAPVYMLLMEKSAMGGRFFLVAVVLTVGVAGFCVHPVQQGADELTDSELSKAVQEVQGRYGEDGLWITVETPYAIPNLLAASGAKTINTTNEIPNNELWESIDDTGGNEEIYNRYAHIRVRLTKKNTEFKLLLIDAFEVSLNAEDLKKMGVRYLVSSSDLANKLGERVLFDEVARANGYTIYRLSYPD